MYSNSLEIPWNADGSIRENRVVCGNVEVQVVQLHISFDEALQAVDHQLRRDVVVFEYRVRFQLFYASFVQVSFDVFVPKKSF